MVDTKALENPDTWTSQERLEQAGITFTPVDPAALADDAEIRNLYAQATQAEEVAIASGRSALQLYRALGEKLATRKPQLGHGNWLPYLEKQGIQERRAQRAMRLAKEWDRLESKSDSVTDLTLTDAIALLADPKPIEQRYELTGDLATPTWDELQRLYAQIGDIVPRRVGPGFAVVNEKVGAPFPIVLQSRDIAWKAWQSKYRAYAEKLTQQEGSEGERVVLDGSNASRGKNEGSEESAEPLRVFSKEEFQEWKADLRQLRQRYGMERRDSQGRDVTNLPGLWDEADTVAAAESPIVTPAHPAGILASAKKNQHGTPEFLWRPGLETFGIEQFDLDPASYEGSPIPCKKIFTKEDNGLEQDWEAEYLWSNFPYSSDEGKAWMGQWVDKLLYHYNECHVRQALTLVKCDCRPEWFRNLFYEASAYCLVWNSFAFEGNDNSSFFGAVIFYFGGEVDRFYRAYSPIGGIGQELNPELFGE